MYEFKVVVSDKEDAEFMISSVRGVAETNKIKLENEIELVELPKVILSKELRDKILSDEDFLRSYALNTFMGDGLEYDHAGQLLEDEGDEFIVESYLNLSGSDDEIINELRKYPEFAGQIDTFDRERLGETDEEEKEN